MQKIALPLAACLLAIAFGAHAQVIWKWRDASGQLHISDMAPPSDVPAKNIVQRPNGTHAAASPAASAPASPASAGESDLQKKKAKADKDKADKEAADKAAADQKLQAARRDNCQRAQIQVQGMQNGGRVSTMNAKGEREFLDDTARAAELKRAQDIAAQNCGPLPASPQ